MNTNFPQSGQQKASNHCGTRLLPEGLILPESVHGLTANRGEQIIGYTKPIVHPKFTRHSKLSDSGQTRREFLGSCIPDRQKSASVTPETLKPGYGSLQGNGKMVLHARLSLHRQVSGSPRYNSRLIVPLVFDHTTRMIRMIGRPSDPLYGYLEVNVVRTLLRGSPIGQGKRKANYCLK